MLRLVTVYACNDHEDNHSFIGHLSVFKGGFADYGITGCGVFKAGVKNWKGF